MNQIVVAKNPHSALHGLVGNFVALHQVTGGRQSSTWSQNAIGNLVSNVISDLLIRGSRVVIAEGHLHIIRDCGSKVCFDVPCIAIAVQYCYTLLKTFNAERIAMSRTHVRTHDAELIELVDSLVAAVAVNRPSEIDRLRNALESFGAVGLFDAELRLSGRADAGDGRCGECSCGELAHFVGNPSEGSVGVEVAY